MTATPPRLALVLLTPLLLAGFCLSCSGCGSTGPARVERGVVEDAGLDAGGGAAADGGSAPRVVVVRAVGEEGDEQGGGELDRDLREVVADVERWAPGWRLAVLKDGEAPPDAAEAEIVAGLLPLPVGARQLAVGMPVTLGEGVVGLAGTVTANPDAALAVRVPFPGASPPYASPDAPPEVPPSGAPALPRWLVVGQRPAVVARMVAETTFHLAGFTLEGWGPGTDYMLREASWKRRAGRWVAVDGPEGAAAAAPDVPAATNGGGPGTSGGRGSAGPAFRAVDQRDDFAELDRWFAGLYRFPAGSLTVLAPADAGAAARTMGDRTAAGGRRGGPDGAGASGAPAAGREGRGAPDAPDALGETRGSSAGSLGVGGGEGLPAPGRLAAELAAAAEAMARHLPFPVGTLRRDPLTVAVETSYPQMIVHTGGVGEAVAGGPADVHLVFHPDDGFAYRHALAAALMRRAGVGGELPPYLRLGAAWWLVERSGGVAVRPAPEALWYGRPSSDWLPRLAAAGVLPTVDELLAAEEPPDGSRLLWTPLAAAVVEALPGETLAEKVDGAGEGELRGVADALLARVAASAVTESASVPALRDAGPSPGSSGLVGGGEGPLPGFSGLVGGGEGPSPGSSGLVGGGEGPLPGSSGLVGGVKGQASESGRDPVPPFLAGISLAMLNHVHLGYHAPSVDAALVNLRRAVAADAVSLMPFAYQRRPDEPRLVYLNRRPRSETDVAMLHAGRRAEARGVTVLWKPQIWLSGSWPGEVEMTSEADWEAWFRSYRRFLVHQAVLADRVGAEILSVGVELGRTVERTEDWHRVLDAVELVYGGPLTYSANWFGDFDRVTFWDRLDFLGMDAYEPLTDDPAAGDAELAAGARRVVAHLEAAARRFGASAPGRAGKPLILTELGFAAHQAAWVAPHEEGGPLSPEDQARAYRALFEALGRPPWLRGVFIWKAFSSGPRHPGGGEETGERGEDFADFRFLGRPAEGVIREYFSGPPGPPAPSVAGDGATAGGRLHEL